MLTAAGLLAGRSAMSSVTFKRYLYGCIGSPHGRPRVLGLWSQGIPPCQRPSRSPPTQPQHTTPCGRLRNRPSRSVGHPKSRPEQTSSSFSANRSGLAVPQLSSGHAGATRTRSTAAASASAAAVDTLTITRPDDWHLHVRDGQAMRVRQLASCKAGAAISHLMWRVHSCTAGIMAASGAGSALR